MQGRRPFDPNIDTEDPEDGAENTPRHGPNGSKMEPLTFRRPSEIFAMGFDDSDFILKNGYIAKGDPFAICGAAGIGKSRLILQLLIAIITGRDFHQRKRHPLAPAPIRKRLPPPQKRPLGHVFGPFR
jgi:hypothetical protein